MAVGRTVILLDKNRENTVETTVPQSNDMGARIVVDSIGYQNVDEAPDGTWRYAPV